MSGKESTDSDKYRQHLCFLDMVYTHAEGWGGEFCL
jgi:hypothetical protein